MLVMSTFPSFLHTYYAVCSVLLIVHLTKQGCSTFDPVIDWFVARQEDGEDEVGRVTGRRQGSLSLARLVNGTSVAQ